MGGNIGNTALFALVTIFMGCVAGKVRVSGKVRTSTFHFWTGLPLPGTRGMCSNPFRNTDRRI